MRRREFIGLLGGAAAAWPLETGAQQRTQMRHIGFLIGLPADDPEGYARHAAFLQGLQELGWTVGRNLRMDYRSAAGVLENYPKYAAELIAAGSDVLVAGGTGALAALMQATRTLPIVFANAVDPVGSGYVASLARPGGNATGFMNTEFGLAAKWLELLKQIAPRITRAIVIRNPGPATGYFAAMQAVAPSLGVELIPVSGVDAGEMERAITTFARGPNDGMIVTGQLARIQRDLAIALAARHRLPAVYPFRSFVTEGGLASFGIDQSEPYRLAAGYVDRILKGERPADLPVQAATKFDTVINLKTAKALGLDVPPTLLAVATEVIE